MAKIKIKNLMNNERDGKNFPPIENKAVYHGILNKFLIWHYAVINFKKYFLYINLINKKLKNTISIFFYFFIKLLFILKIYNTI